MIAPAPMGVGRGRSLTRRLSMSLSNAKDDRDFHGVDGPPPRRRAKVRRVDGTWEVTLSGGSVSYDSSWEDAVGYAHRMTSLYCDFWFGERP
jgi:hypothetical protein